MTGVAILSAWGMGLALLLYCHRAVLVSLWREPMLRAPVMIIESDDWGPGPENHAMVLRRLTELLSRFRDANGRKPVMTLGIILALPDTQRMRQEGLKCYRRQLLSDQRFDGIVQAIWHGCRVGVFSVQLHGMEHFWPGAVWTSAENDDRIKDWLTQEGLPNTEDLPAHLQSRWIDGSSLPSGELNERDIRGAAREEIAAFANIFRSTPQVVVPPTFVWSSAVEEAWAAGGVRVIVTPGRRYESRDSKGSPVPVGSEIRNGELRTAGLTNIVRNDYFEPALGHRADKAMRALERKTLMGRPTLFETHRFNFTRDPEVLEQSLSVLSEAINRGLSRYPDLTFLSTAELAEQLRTSGGALIESRMTRRITVWLERVNNVPRLRKLAWLTGLALLAAPVVAFSRSRRRPAEA